MNGGAMNSSVRQSIAKGKDLTLVLSGAFLTWPTRSPLATCINMRDDAGAMRSLTKLTLQSPRMSAWMTFVQDLLQQN